MTGWGWLIHSESPSLSTSPRQHSPDRVQPEGVSEMYPSEFLWLWSCCRQSQGVPQPPCPQKRCWRGKKSGALTEKETLSSCSPPAGMSSADPVPCLGPLEGHHAPSSSVMEVTINTASVEQSPRLSKIFGTGAGYSARRQDTQVQLATLGKPISSHASTSLLSISQHQVEKMLKHKHTHGGSCRVSPGTRLTPNMPSWQRQGQELNLHLPWGPDACGNHPA